MRTALIVTLLLTSGAAAAAQAVTPQQPPAQAPQGLSVLRFNWYDNTHPQGWDDPVFTAKNKTDDNIEPPRALGRTATPAQDPALNPNRNLPAPFDPKAGPPPKIEQYVYRVKVRNEGEKRIEALEWDYVFVDAATQKVLAHHRFNSPSRINAQGSATLTATSSAPPSRVVGAKAVEKDSRKPFDEYVVIRCVAYADGTIWKHPEVGDGGCAVTARMGRKGKE